MSLLSRLWAFIRRPTGFIGKDLEGNFFYEYAASSNDPRRTRRVMKYKGKTDMLEIANRNRNLAVQWKAWLTHTRKDPPTLDELRADIIRQQRVLANVALIAERDREERLRLAQSTAVAELQNPGDPLIDVSSRTSGGDQTQSRSKQSTGQQSNPWVPPPASDEPEAWRPRSVRRGG